MIRSSKSSEYSLNFQFQNEKSRISPLSPASDKFNSPYLSKLSSSSCLFVSKRVGELEETKCSTQGAVPIPLLVPPTEGPFAVTCMAFVLPNVLSLPLSYCQSYCNSVFKSQIISYGTSNDINLPSVIPYSTLCIRTNTVTKYVEMNRLLAKSVAIELVSSLFPTHNLSGSGNSGMWPTKQHDVTENNGLAVFVSTPISSSPGITTGLASASEITLDIHPRAQIGM